MAKMDDSELLAIVDGEMRNSQGFGVGRLADQRLRALSYFLGEAKGDLEPPEIEGRSSVVINTLRNQVMWMLPTIMKTFCSGESVVDFEPTTDTPEADKQAKLASDYCNHIFFKQNDGYNQLQTSILDSLVQKNGIIKVWWDATVDETKTDYKGLSVEELTLLLDSEEESEVISQKSYPDEEDIEHRQEALQHLAEQLQQVQDPNQAQAIQGQIEQIYATPEKLLYDITIKRKTPRNKVCVESVPPEDFIISKKAKTIQDALFVAHRVWLTESDLKARGYKNVDQITSDENGQLYSAERIERLSYDDETAPYNFKNTPDNTTRPILVNECYIKVDWDGDGIAEWRKVVKAGNTLLENEEVDEPPFVALRAIVLPHKFFGLSMYDLAKEPMKIQTQLARAMIDNVMLQVNGRYFALDGQVNLDDLLYSRPGSTVRVKSIGAVGRLDQGMGDVNSAMEMMQYMQAYNEDATGWTQRSQGTGMSGLQQQTATGMNIITNRDDMRLDLIIRNLADGIKDIFRLILKNILLYQDKETKARIGGQFVTINPNEWKDGFDLNISVGLGTSNKEQQAQHYMSLLALQEKGMAIGLSNRDTVYSLVTDYTKAILGQVANKYWLDPKTNPAPQQPDPEMMKFQAEQQQDIHKFQAQAQLEREKEQLKAQARERELQLEAEKNQMQAQLDMQERQHQATLQAQLETQKLALDEWKTRLDAEVRLAIAQMNAVKQLDVPELYMANQDLSGGYDN